MIRLAIVDTVGSVGLDMLHAQTATQLAHKFPVEVEVWTTEKFGRPLDNAVKVIKAFGGPQRVWTRRALIALQAVMLPWRLSKNVEVVHLHFFDHAAVYLYWTLAMRLRRKKVVVTAHDVVPLRNRTQRMSWIEKRLYRSVDAIIVLHNKLELEVSLLNRVFVVPHGGYDVAPCNPSVGSNRILFFGQFKKAKGLDVLLESCALLQANGVKFTLTIAGKDVDNVSKELNALIYQNNLQNKTEMLEGYMDDEEANLAFCRCDVVVLPYKWGYQSGVLHLAASFGRPVVVTDVGGIGETVRKWGNGVVVRPRDAVALADGLMKILTDEALRREMATRGLRCVREESAAEGLYHVYEAVLASPSRVCG